MNNQLNEIRKAVRTMWSNAYDGASSLGSYTKTMGTEQFSNALNDISRALDSLEKEPVIAVDKDGYVSALELRCEGLEELNSNQKEGMIERGNLVEEYRRKVERLEKERKQLMEPIIDLSARNTRILELEKEKDELKVRNTWVEGMAASLQSSVHELNEDKHVLENTVDELEKRKGELEKEKMALCEVDGWEKENNKLRNALRRIRNVSNGVL